MPHTKKPYSRHQLIWIYKQYLLEEAKLVHRIFDNVIVSMLKQLSAAIISGNYDARKLIYTGFQYDPTSQKSYKLEETPVYHSIYVKLINDEEQPYEAYINMRRVLGVPQNKLKHDKIVVNINVPVVKNSIGSISSMRDMIRMSKRIASLLAHELTHARDMWSSNYVNIINNLLNQGYNEASLDFLKTEDITNVTEEQIRMVNAMLYLMSPAETDVIYEQFDKFLKLTPDSTLLYFIGSDPFEDKRMIAAKVLSGVNNEARVVNPYINLRLEDFATHKDYVIPVLFTAYAVYLGFIPDTSGYFKDFSVAKEVIDGNLTPDENMTKMMLTAFEELEIKYGEFVADIEDIIIEQLEERGIFNTVCQNELNEVFLYPYPSLLYDEKLSIYGQLSEMESPFQPFLFWLTINDIPAIHALLESENRDKSVGLYEFLGHR